MLHACMYVLAVNSRRWYEFGRWHVDPAKPILETVSQLNEPAVTSVP